MLVRAAVAGEWGDGTVVGVCLSATAEEGFVLHVDHLPFVVVFLTDLVFALEGHGF